MEASTQPPSQQTQQPQQAAPQQPASTDDLIRQVIAEQQQHRAEVAALRQQLDEQQQRHTPPPAPSNTPQSPEEALKARMEEVNQHDYYCPGCGKLVDYQQQCTGRGESPHPPLEVVSTDELKAGDTEKYTAAPSS